MVEIGINYNNRIWVDLAESVALEDGNVYFKRVRRELAANIRHCKNDRERARELVKFWVEIHDEAETMGNLLLNFLNYTEGDE